MSLKSSPEVWEYVINLNERGQFYADVRNTNGDTVFEIKNEDDGSVAMIEDGFMNHPHDTNGLLEYLVSVGIADASVSLRLVP